MHAAALAFRLRLFLFLGELLALAALLLVALALLRFLLRLRFGAALGAAVFGASGVSSCALGSAGGDPGLDRLDLGDVAGDRDLGVVLGARLGAAPSPERFRSCSSRARRSALRCARVFAIGSYRVSLCAVWWPHQRQNLRISIRSGELRRDLLVW